jgi:DNA-binding transcriptional regulator YbjK
MCAMAGFASPKGEQTYRRILDATLQVIADEGVRAVTHRRVATEASASPGLISYYFSTTEDLISGALGDLAMREGAAFDRLRLQVESLRGDVPGLVEVFVAEVLLRATQEKTSTTAAMALTLELAGQHLDREVFEPWEAAEFALCDAVIAALGAEPDFDLSLFLSTALDGLFLNAVISPSAHLLEPATRTGLTQLFEGLRARGRAQRRARQG